MRQVPVALMILGLTFLGIPSPPAEAATDSCEIVADMGQADGTCRRTAAEVRQLYREGPTSGFQYRLNNGPWQDIPNPHTVPGPTTQPLTILEARPALVP